MAPTEKHPFEPFLPAGARILFMGSFPPQEHRWCMPFYYPNWINDFWRIMGLIHFGDKSHFCLPGEKRFDEAAIRAFCLEAGLAFYDTACEVRRLRDNASDAFLEVVTPTDIPALLARIPECHTLVTTGEKASAIVAATFSCPVPPVGESIVISTALSVIPSEAKESPLTRRRSLPDSSGNYFSSQAQKNQFPRMFAASPSFHGLSVESPPLRFYRMPSTSRAYPLPLEKKAAAYRQLFK